MVVVNLYPFRATVTAEQAPTFDVAVENIDIGANTRSQCSNPHLCVGQPACAPQLSASQAGPTQVHGDVFEQEAVPVAGGPAMIRAAAKNHEHVTVVVDPSDYQQLADALAGGQAASDAAAFRRRLAWKAFQHTATYDSTVAEWLWSQVGAHIILYPTC